MIKIGINGWMHHKNQIGVELMNSESNLINFSTFNNSGSIYDYLMQTSCTRIMDLNNFSKGIIYGPHFDFKDETIKDIPSQSNIIINFLSPWLKKLADEIYPGKNTANLPFPVDVDRFKPGLKKGKPVIYFKKRSNEILNKFLSFQDVDSFKIFNYSSGYSESEFKESISVSPFCVWIGCHESQGFAFQETLSSGTPIFVIDVNSLRDEIGGGWGYWKPDTLLDASSASYFDERCGILSDTDKMENDYNHFMSLLNLFDPRDFVMNNLSPEACVKKWIQKLS